MTLLALKPESIFCKLFKLFIVNPAAINNVNDKANWQINKVFLKNPWSVEYEDLPPSFSELTKFTLAKLGTMPAMIPKIVDIAKANSITVVSIVISDASELKLKAKSLRKSNPKKANNSPKPPPIKDNKRLSVNNNCASLTLLAPKEARTANSRFRFECCDNVKLVTFAEAIKNSNNVVANKVYK